MPLSARGQQTIQEHELDLQCLDKGDFEAVRTGLENVKRLKRKFPL